MKEVITVDELMKLVGEYDQNEELELMAWSECCCVSFCGATSNNQGS